MLQRYSMQAIATIQSDFPTKFGIPRQSGLIDALESTIVFEPEFRNSDSLRGLEGFSHLWLVWIFDQSIRERWSPTVRPPRLGGNQRMGVFASRSPFRPNPIGLSCVRLAGIEHTKDLGTVLKVHGADLMNGTPILDIKPYIPYADSHPDAQSGFASEPVRETLEVMISSELLACIPENRWEALRAILAQDPRPRYQDDANRIYGFVFAGLEVKFCVEGTQLNIINIRKVSENILEE